MRETLVTTNVLSEMVQDVLYVSCFYWLINEAAFSQWLNRVKLGRKYKQRGREREGGVRKKICSHTRRQMPSPEPPKLCW